MCDSHLITGSFVCIGSSVYPGGIAILYVPTSLSGRG